MACEAALFVAKKPATTFPRMEAFVSPQFRRSSHLFTSESVTMGHPDKVADQISDAVLDSLLAKDKFARVACETLVTTGLIVVAGEVTVHNAEGIIALNEIEDTARQTVRSIGYD